MFQHFSEVLDLLARGISLRKGIMPIEYQVRQYDLHKQHAALFREILMTELRVELSLS